jgi:hypothetical protein
MLSYTPAALYAVAIQQHPEGVSSEAFIPVSIDGAPFELRYVTDRGNGDDVEFQLFLSNRRYSRRTIIVYADGRVVDDVSGKLPESDLVPGELPHATPLDAVLREIFAVLQSNVRT